MEEPRPAPPSAGESPLVGRTFPEDHCQDCANETEGGSASQKGQSEDRVPEQNPRRPGKELLPLREGALREGPFGGGRGGPVERPQDVPEVRRGRQCAPTGLERTSAAGKGGTSLERGKGRGCAGPGRDPDREHRHGAETADAARERPAAYAGRRSDQRRGSVRGGKGPQRNAHPAGRRCPGAGGPHAEGPGVPVTRPGRDTDQGGPTARQNGGSEEGRPI